MNSVGTFIQGKFSSLSENLFSKNGKDFFGASTIAALGMALYYNLSRSIPSKIGSQLALPQQSPKNEKSFFLPGEEEKMRSELDRLKKSVNTLWESAKKEEPKSILKKRTGGKKVVQFSNNPPDVQKLFRLKDGPLLETRIDLSPEPKLQEKKSQQSLF